MEKKNKQKQKSQKLKATKQIISNAWSNVENPFP